MQKNNEKEENPPNKVTDKLQEIKNKKLEEIHEIESDQKGISANICDFSGFLLRQEMVKKRQHDKYKGLFDIDSNYRDYLKFLGIVIIG